MRIPFTILLVVFTMGFVEAASDLEQKLDLAREAEDTHAEIELLRRWLDLHPNDAEAVEELTGLWLQVPDFGMALETLKAAHSPDPGLVARTNAEVAWRRDDNLGESLKLLHDRSESAPKDRETRLLLADYLAKAGESREEIAVLDTLIAEESNFDLLLDRAGAKMAADDPKGALADFRKASADSPDETRVQNARAGFERLEKAVEANESLDKMADSPALHFEKGYWWLYGGMTNLALAEATAGLKTCPDSTGGKILETRALVAKGGMDSSKARLERHIDVSTALEDESVLRGILQADEALAKKSATLSDLSNRAYWLLSAAQYLLALDDLEAVLKTDPSNIPALHLAVAANLRLGNLPAATAYAQKLSNLKTSKNILADVFAGLAQMAFEQSKFPLALDFADRSLAAMSSPTVWKLKAACYTRLGQTNEAAAALKKAEKGSR